MTLTITVAEVAGNLYKTMDPGKYKLAEVLCEETGYPKRMNTRGRHRAKVRP